MLFDLAPNGMFSLIADGRFLVGRSGLLSAFCGEFGAPLLFFSVFGVAHLIHVSSLYGAHGKPILRIGPRKSHPCSGFCIWVFWFFLFFFLMKQQESINVQCDEKHIPNPFIMLVR